MGILIFAALIGLIPAFLAKNKGRSFGAWWAFGALLFIVALPMALLMKPIMVSPSGQRVPLENTSVGLVTCASCTWQVPSGLANCPNCGGPLNTRSLPRDLAGRILGEQAPTGQGGPPVPGGTWRLCPQGHQVGSTAQFCPNCGSPMTARCQNGHLVGSGEQFCGQCGCAVHQGQSPTGTSAH
jgi:predicted RNA-binding Zn-ribbon protein involved in translation (DUF1610 family)